jgi:hypothetical protein
MMCRTNWKRPLVNSRRRAWNERLTSPLHSVASDIS